MIFPELDTNCDSFRYLAKFMVEIEQNSTNTVYKTDLTKHDIQRVHTTPHTWQNHEI